MARLAIHYCIKKVKLSCLWVFMIMVLLNLTSHARPQVLGWNFPLSLSILRRVSNLNWLFNCLSKLRNYSLISFTRFLPQFSNKWQISFYLKYQLHNFMNTNFDIFWIINRTFHLKDLATVQWKVEILSCNMQRCLTNYVFYFSPTTSSPTTCAKKSSQTWVSSL